MIVGYFVKPICSRLVTPIVLRQGMAKHAIAWLGIPPSAIYTRCLSIGSYNWKSPAQHVRPKYLRWVYGEYL